MSILFTKILLISHGSYCPTQHRLYFVSVHVNTDLVSQSCLCWAVTWRCSVAWIHCICRVNCVARSGHIGCIVSICNKLTFGFCFLPPAFLHSFDGFSKARTPSVFEVHIFVGLLLYHRNKRVYAFPGKMIDFFKGLYQLQVLDIVSKVVKTSTCSLASILSLTAFFELRSKKLYNCMQSLLMTVSELF